MSMITELIEKLRGQASLLDEVDNLAIKAIKSSLKEAANVIEELSAKLHDSQMERSSQYYHGGWIPCEERMPEEKDYKLCHENYDGAVLWCNDDGLIGVGWYYESTKQWSDINDNGVNGKVVAWRPLPEPYSPNEEEVTDADND